MHLVRLLYVSTALEAFTSDSLEELGQAAARANLVRGVTGVLLYSDGSFLQVIEGRRLEIDALYRSITQDPRHACIERLLYEQDTRRVFPDWTMALHNLDMAEAMAPNEFRPIREFLDRFAETTSAEVTHKSLVEFQSQLAVCAGA